MTDLINRADAVSTVIKWASGEGGDIVDLIESLPSAHVKTDGDLISRQIAIDGVIKSCLGVSNVVIAEAKAINYIKKIPSASAEAVQGEWMWTEHDDPCYFRCSNCGRMSDEDSDFCPNCGARMIGGEDE